MGGKNAQTPGVLWITEQFTKPGGGARICMLRHALALQEEGVAQHFVVPSRYGDTMEHREMVKQFGAQSLAVIPARKPWWPPIRSWLPFSRALRSRLVLDAIIGHVRKFKPSVIITTNYLSFPSFAIGVARKLDLPLAVVVYDAVEDWQENGPQRETLLARTRLLFDRAEHIWFVSRELRSVYENRGLLREPAKTSILFPIPTKAKIVPAGWREEMAAGPVIGFAGQVHAIADLESVELCAMALGRLGGRLLLSIPEEQRALLEPLQKRNVCELEFVPWQSTPEAALAMMSARVSAMLVPCGMKLPRGAMAMTSFPSKLLDYCRMELPVVILAAPKTPVMRWAAEAGWPTCLADPDVDACVVLLGKLKERAFWEAASHKARQAAESDFDPLKIHAQFRAELPLAKKQGLASSLH